MQTTTFKNVLDISSAYKGILLDAYGVFWGGNSSGLLPGSKEAMEKLVSEKTVGILSNSTQLAAKETHKLQQHGIIQGKHFHFIVTSGEIAKKVFVEKKLPFDTPRHKFWLFGGIHPKSSSPLTLFEGSPYTETKHLDEADFIYIAIPHKNGESQTNPDVFLKEITELKKTNLPMVCANPDRFVHDGTSARAIVCQGSIAAIYEQLGGQVFYIGKPHSFAYEEAMELFKKEKISNPADILMVGDTPETDIRGANKFGMASALTIKTGIMSGRMQHHDAHLQLPLEDQPRFFIERLGSV